MVYEYAVAFVVGGVGGLLLGSILYEPRERRPLFPFPHMKRRARNAPLLDVGSPRMAGSEVDKQLRATSSPTSNSRVTASHGRLGSSFSA